MDSIVASPIDWSRVPEDRVYLSLGITLGLIGILAVFGVVALIRHRRRPRP